MFAPPVRFLRFAVAGLCALALGAALAAPAHAAVWLSDGSVSPASGTTSALFTWRIQYRSQTNALPNEVRVAIRTTGGTPTWPLMAQLDPTDTTTTDGKWYTYSARLAPGAYQYRFAARTGSSWAYWPQPTGTWVSGPGVAFYPLALGSLSPTSGTTTTLFTWRIQYWNQTNALPNEVRVAIGTTGGTPTWPLMAQLDPTDTTTTDGKWYTYSAYLPPGVYEYRFAARTGSSWAYWPQPTGTWVAGPTVGDETAIRNLYQQFEQCVEAENLTGTMSLFSDSFLHDGANKAAFSVGAAQFFAEHSGIAVTITNLVISLTGDTATASFHWRIDTNEGLEVDDDMSPSHDDMGICFLRKESGVWRFYGNQQWYGTDVFSGYGGGSNYWLELWVGDSAHRATSVTVSGAGIPANTPLTWYQGWSGWSWFVNIGLPTPPPTPPMTYTFTITDAYGVTVLEDVVESYCTQLASNLWPSGGQTVPGTPTFTWTGVSLPGATYGVEVYDPYGNGMWQVHRLTTTWVQYGGPPLTSGALYTWDVVVRDTNGNISIDWETFRAG